MSCLKCGVMRDVVACINDVANIKRDLKCGVEYMECGVMWHVSNVKWGAMRDVSGVRHNVARQYVKWGAMRYVSGVMHDTWHVSNVKRGAMRDVSGVQCEMSVVRCMMWHVSNV